ncbi:MAG: GerMN domain-containing protein [Tissierellales bacterium]|nr:GerMN domain-containing protein [Tissierellales bacterium]
MKKFLILSLSVLLILSLSACSTNNDELNEPEIPIDETPIENPDNGNTTEPEPEENYTKEVTLYFANNDYVETGNEEYDWLIEEKREINFEGTTLEEAVVRELMKGPVDTENMSTGFPSTVKLIDVKVDENKTCYVNFAQDGLYGGSMEESYIIAQVVNSLVGLDSVDRVQFLIDGKPAETLMGHISIEEPFESFE